MSAVFALVTRQSCVTPAAARSSSTSSMAKAAGGLIQFSGL